MEQLVREEYRHLRRRFDAVDHIDAEDERRTCADYPPCAVHVSQRNHQIDEYLARVQLGKFRNHIRPERGSLLSGSCLCEALDQRPEFCSGIDHAATCGGRGICRYEKAAHQGDDGEDPHYHYKSLTLGP